MLESRVQRMEGSLGTRFSPNHATERLAKGIGYTWSTGQPQRFFRIDFGCFCTYVQSGNNT